MNDEYQKLLSEALEYENQGRLEQALAVYGKALASNEANPGPALFQMAICYFTNRDYEKSLDLFVRCHGHGYRCEEIQSIVFEAYYEPNKEQFKKVYTNNISRLKDYLYNPIAFPAFDELNFCFIPYNDSKYIVFDLKKNKFLNTIELEGQIGTLHCNSSVFMIIDEYKIKTLEHYKRETIPLYLYYVNITSFIEHLQLCSIDRLLSTSNVTFFFGEREIEEWFHQENVIFPSDFINPNDIENHAQQIIEQAKHMQMINQTIGYEELMLTFQRYINRAG